MLKYLVNAKYKKVIQKYLENCLPAQKVKWIFHKTTFCNWYNSHNQQKNSIISNQKEQTLDKRWYTCPSAIINKTWYCPPLCSTMDMAISIIGAKDVGPGKQKI